jgi:hypothetical protein
LIDGDRREFRRSWRLDSRHVHYFVGLLLKKDEAVPAVGLSDAHLTYLLTLLRNSPRPMTTEELVEALLERVKRSGS